MIICISNWEKYNPRKRGDTKSASWFRCQNNFLIDPDFYDYSNDQKMVWLYFLAEGSAKLSATIKVNPNLAASILRVDADLVVSTIREFENAGLLSIVANSQRTRSELAANSQPEVGATYVRTEKKRALAAEPLTPLAPAALGAEPEKGDQSVRPKYEPCDLNLAARWLAHAKTITPKLSANLGKWADSVRLLREQDGLTLDEVTKVFEWVKDDPFWRLNAVSPQSIRGRSKNGLKKIENIRLRMQESPTAETDAEWEARMARELEDGKK